jgi:hypothetical protein
MAGSYSAVNQLLSEHADSGSRVRARTFSPPSGTGEATETFVLLEGREENAQAPEQGRNLCRMMQLAPTRLRKLPFPV